LHTALHAPFVQTACALLPAVHVFPQAPHEPGSDLGSTQPSPHLANPTEHWKPHTPALHTGIAFAGVAQECPHSPQFSVFVSVSKHPVPQ
jgi:hypothetical protein